MDMRRMAVALALVALAAGCGEKEREDVRFGYRRGDSDYESFFTVGFDGAVTNYLPARVLNVLYDYAYTADELALLRDAGVVTPGAPLKALPEGYRTRVAEPWFTTWESDAARFGEKGMAGLLAHYDPDAKEYQPVESFFSSYWKTRGEADAAQGRLRAKIAETYHPKKFWAWPKSGCWIAEYVRLRVISIVGQRPDGLWSCMLSFYDKCRRDWEDYADVKEQQLLLDDWQYGKDCEVWAAARRKNNDAKHAAVLKICRERGYRVADGERWGDGTDGTAFYLNDGGTIDTNRTSVAGFVAEKIAALAARYGVRLSEPPPEKSPESPYADHRVALATNDLYRVMFSYTVFRPLPPPPPDAEGLHGADTNAEAAVSAKTEPPPQPAPCWECRITELPLKGFELAPHPAYPQPGQ